LIPRLQALRRGERGQALVLCVLVLAGLLGVASLVVDGGNALLQRRNQQGVADAAALAAVKDLPGDAAAADAAARAYATTENSADGSVVDSVTITGSTSSTCDGGFGATVLAPSSVCVVVHSDAKGVFSGLLGIDAFKASARAIAKVSQVTGVGGWLPFGIRQGAYDADTPTQVAITPSDQSRNVGGAVNTPAGSDCKFYGGDGISDVIRGARFGGVDACPITIGQPIETQTGVTTGNITNKGFDVRIGGNTDSFSDVFGQDADGNYYVKNTASPRLGVIPIAKDTSGNWPLTGGATMTMTGYVLVYIGATTRPPDYPAYSGSGSRLTIYLTPVNAPLPDGWGAILGDYSAANPSPLVYQLVS
jgi:hypothetical protein